MEAEQNNTTTTTPPSAAKQQEQKQTQQNGESDGPGGASESSRIMQTENRFHLAAADGDLNKVKFFCNKRSVNEMDEKGNVPLHHATWYNQAPVVQYLVSKMLTRDVNLANHQGNTALHLAVANGESHIPVIQLLLQAGAMITASNKLGLSPKDLVSRHSEFKQHRQILVQFELVGAQHVSSMFVKSVASLHRKHHSTIHASAAPIMNTNDMGGAVGGHSQWVNQDVRAVFDALSTVPTLQPVTVERSATPSSVSLQSPGPGRGASPGAGRRRRLSSLSTASAAKPRRSSSISIQPVHVLGSNRLPVPPNAANPKVNGSATGTLTATATVHGIGGGTGGRHRTRLSIYDAESLRNAQEREQRALSKQPRLDGDAIKKLLQFLGAQPSSGEIEELFKLMDINKDGMVDFRDFIRVMMYEDQWDEQWALAAPFDALDHDQDGVIGKEDMTYARTQIGKLLFADTDFEVAMTFQELMNMEASDAAIEQQLIQCITADKTSASKRSQPKIRGLTHDRFARIAHGKFQNNS
jgi:ankyrin repeat protein/Ca2+-binding EF-hand superfamily protein